MDGFQIKEYKDINLLNDFSHDHYFDLDKISFGNNIFTIPLQKPGADNVRVLKKFLFFRMLEIPVLEFDIKVFNCTSFELTDTEQIGIYAINTFEYFSQLGILKVNTAPDLNIVIHVDNLLIEVSEIGRHVGWKKRFVIGNSKPPVNYF